MKPEPRKLRSPLKWHGGKSYLARRIIALFPPHERYVEPFAGGLSVLLNKPRAPSEHANDLNAGLIRTYRTIRDYGNSLEDVLGRTPYDLDTFQAAAHDVKGDGARDDIDFAAAFIVRNRMSRGGMGKDFAWSDRLRGGRPGDVNAWQTSVKEIPRVGERLQYVTVSTLDATDIIEREDHPGTLIYLDPPYVPATRTVKKVYDHEMTSEAHETLLGKIQWREAMVFISGYRHPLYDDRLADWTRHDFEMPNHAGQGKTKQRRVECVWESPN